METQTIDTETIDPTTKKITFNCPQQIFLKLEKAQEGNFSSRTDLILTALRSYLGIT